MFSTLRMTFAILLITGIAGAGMYVMKLRADNATLKANQIELEKGIEDVEKFEDGNKSAGTRIRKNMQDVKSLAQQVRVEVQEMKNAVAA